MRAVLYCTHSLKEEKKMTFVCYVRMSNQPPIETRIQADTHSQAQALLDAQYGPGKAYVGHVA